MTGLSGLDKRPAKEVFSLTKKLNARISALCATEKVIESYCDLIQKHRECEPRLQSSDSQVLSFRVLQLFMLPDGEPIAYSGELLTSRRALFMFVSDVFNRCVSEQPLSVGLLVSLLEKWLAFENLFALAVKEQASRILSPISSVVNAVILFRESRGLERVLPAPHSVQKRVTSLHAIEATLQGIYKAVGIFLPANSSPELIPSASPLLIAAALVSDRSTSVQGLWDADQVKCALARFSAKSADRKAMRILSAWEELLEAVEVEHQKIHTAFPLFSEFPRLRAAMMSVSTAWISAGKDFYQ